MEEALRQLVEQATWQHGVVTRAQLLDAGVGSELIRSRLRRRSWQRIHPGVYAVFPGELKSEARAWAAVLYAGPGALASYHTAAELWRLADEPSSVVHVTVPGGRRVRKQAGIVIHLSGRAGKSAHSSRLPPQTRLEETVLDLWEAARDLDTAVGWITRAIGRWLTTQDLLLLALAERRRIRWRSQLAELLSPDFAGIHSVLEYHYVRDVERPHNFPVATRQAHSRQDGQSQYRDTLYEQYNTIVELDGRAAHPGDTRWDDIRRDNAAAASGRSTLRYGWRDVRPTPCAVAAQVAAVLETQGYLDARPCSPGCPVGRLRPRGSRQPAQSPALPRMRGGQAAAAGPFRAGEPARGRRAGALTERSRMSTILVIGNLRWLSLVEWWLSLSDAARRSPRVSLLPASGSRLLPVVVPRPPRALRVLCTAATSMCTPRGHSTPS